MTGHSSKLLSFLYLMNAPSKFSFWSNLAHLLSIIFLYYVGCIHYFPLITLLLTSYRFCFYSVCKQKYGPETVFIFLEPQTLFFFFSLNRSLNFQYRFFFFVEIYFRTQMSSISFSCTLSLWLIYFSFILGGIGLIRCYMVCLQGGNEWLSPPEDTGLCMWSWGWL